VILFFAAVLLFFMDTRREKTEYHFSFDLYRRLIVRYGIFMIGLACFWQISVEASQVAINYSKEFFGKSNSEASLLLIFSSIGAILGNILSVKVSKWRKTSFLILTLFFIVVVFSFSTVLSLAHTYNLYVIVQVLAGVIGFFFGASVNLAESHFYALLGEDTDKEYTSALYGFVLSLVGAILMFLSEKILHMEYYSYLGISLFL
jgi:predicted MFS family arabinose efflux permease